MLAIEDRTGIWVDESRLTPENLRSAESLAACVYEQLANS
jgi:acyl carrier protein